MTRAPYIAFAHPGRVGLGPRIGDERGARCGRRGGAAPKQRRSSADAAPKQSPFYGMYPTDLAPAAESYFGEWNKVLFKKGPMNEKTARLAAISASAAMKCEYCITAQVVLAKAAGATDDEIKGAIQIAAEVAACSS